MKVTTNNVPREIVTFYELPEKEKQEYKDYSDDSGYFQYCGQWYSLDDCMRHVTSREDAKNADWHGAISLSAWTAVMVRLTEDNQVVVGYAQS